MAAKVQPTKEQWKKIEMHIQYTLFGAKLQIDGHVVWLRMVMHRMTGKIAVNVDGQFKGEWLTPEHEMARRFFRTQELSLFTGKQISRFERKFGKRAAKEHGFYKKVTTVSMFWGSFSKMKAHLIKNNDSIVWLDDPASEEAAA